jgi:hypothetical protein
LWVTIGTAAPVVATATAISVGTATSRLRDALPQLRSIFDSEQARLEADVASYGRALQEVAAGREALEARATTIRNERRTTRNARRLAELDAQFEQIKAQVLALPFMR